MNRERMRKTVLAVVGLFYVGLLYPLCSDLWHSHWLLEMQGNDCEPMFLSFFIGLGFFLLLIVRRPSPHRFFIGFAAWSSLFHSAVMAIEQWEAWSHGVRRDYTDVLIAAIVGVVLLAVTPSKREAAVTLSSLDVQRPR